MASEDDDNNVVKINFDLKKAKGAGPTEKAKFLATLEAAKAQMVRGLIIGENESGDIKLITSIEDPEQGLMLVDEAKSFLESLGETPVKDDTD